LLERGRALRGGSGIELFSLGGAISDVGENDTAYSNRGAAFDMLKPAVEHPYADGLRLIHQCVDLLHHLPEVDVGRWRSVGLVQGE
jgi:hypothetical protein